ncbi:uncharacterized protein LOC115696410 [Cannabis sativa]|uniref:uncharacterized protein LOC115696410 n=1 Tax=Cannabis sativa TaxID=3483 RepID=UPI0011DFF232|nr:uncharacterized protein LOC115696410 [Cannabis sativa]
MRVENAFQALDSEQAQQEMARNNEEDTGNMSNTGGGEIPLSQMNKFLCWNVLGANNQQKQRLIKQFISHQKVDFVGLLETRVKALKLGILYSNVFEGWCFSSNIAWHARGKIVIAWNPVRLIVDIISCTSQLMHLKITTMDGMFDSFVTVRYASNNRSERRILWKDICDLKTSERLCLMGDFNEILAKEERLGHRVSSSPDLDSLQCVNSCQLEDIKSSENFYTWSNKQHGDDRIFSKIDIMLANQGWLNTYENAEVLFLNEGLFDHSLVVLTQHPLLVTKLKSLKVVLKYINMEGFSNLQMAVYNAKQKANMASIQDGDSNTTLFHASIRQRVRQNRIFSIEQHNGERVHDPQLVQDAFIEYYKQLLGTRMEKRRAVIDGILRRGPVVTEVQSEMLMRKFTQDEVKKAVFDMSGSKSQGPGGYSSYFYQDNWDTIGDLVSQAVISFLESGKILKEINSTMISLVPKVKCPNTVKYFRPIACCNVIYKIATKMLCSRLKSILPSIISSSQWGFIKGRFIGHNIMIFQDLVRHYGKKSNKPSCLIKLDLQKAYDTVEWGFIEEMLDGLQFPPKFVHLIMQCISTPRCSLMFNGTLHGFFETRRGLRQGDPISPLLFVIGMEYLSRLMGKIGEREDFSFHDRCGELKLNHLAFADDVLLFGKGETKSVMYMLQALKLFSTTSALYPYANKTALYCSNMKDEDIEQVLRSSGFTRGKLPFTYLRIPINAKKISGTNCEILAEKNDSKNLKLEYKKSPSKCIGAKFAYYQGKYTEGLKQSADPFCGKAKETMMELAQLSGAGQESLWMKWVHSVYLRKDEWWSHNASVHASWHWKKLVALKDQLKNLIDIQQFTRQRYSIAAGYKLFTPVDIKTKWSNKVWARLNALKHCHILWLAIHNRLKTKDRLLKFGLQMEETCCFCKEEKETGDHQFFYCQFSQECLQRIKALPGWIGVSKSMPQLIRWIGRSKTNKLKKLVLAAAFATLVYNIWKATNAHYVHA